MATSGLYGSSPTGVTVAAPGSETSGLYGNGTTFGGTYFEWFIFIQSATQPATPTGGSWSFTTNVGTPPSGWSLTPPSAPTLPVWGSIALVNSANSASLTWSAPGLFAYAQGLPVLSGADIPLSGDGVNSQLYIQTGSTPQTIWFKESGTWTRLTGSTLYVDLVNNQTIGGTKTFSSQIQGSISGTSSNVTGVVAIANGGTGQATATNAINALLPSQTGNTGKYLTTDGSNTSWQPTTGAGTVTSVNVSGGTTGLTTSGGPITAAGTITLAGTLAIANGGTGSTSTTYANLASNVYGVLPVNNGGTGVTTSTGSGNNVLSTNASLTTPTQVTYENWTGISAPTYTEGRLWYDSAAHALAYYNDSANATVHIGQDLQVKVINNTGSTIANGSPVYITGTSSGQTYPNIALAKADVAATSSVIGLTNGSIANGAIGYVTSQGVIDGVSTGSFTVGQVLYLSPYSAGQLMNTIPPTGITVQVGVVSYVDASAGKIYVKQTTPLSVPASIITGQVAIANGGTGQSTQAAAITALTGTQTSGYYLRSNGTNSVLSAIQVADVPTLNQNTTGTAANITATSNSTLTTLSALSLPTSQLTGTLGIGNGGTGQTTANAAFNALAPTQTGNSGKYLTTDGTNTSWATNPLGTVTSVAATVPSFLSITGSPITTSGTLAFGLSGTALPTTSGGTGLTSFTANGVVYASSTSALTTGSALTFDGTKLVNTGYNKSSYQVSTGGVGTFESVGAAYLSYASGGNLYSMLNGSGTEDIFNYRASAHIYYIGGVEKARFDTSGNLNIVNLTASKVVFTDASKNLTSTGTVSVAQGGTGTSTPALVAGTNISITGTWPNQTINSSNPGGSVTSVAATVPSFLSVSGSPITTSGTLAFSLSGTALPTTSGGTGLTSFTSGGVVYASSTSALTTGSALTFDGTKLGVGVASPVRRLDVSGQMRATSSTVFAEVDADSSSGVGYLGTASNHPIGFKLNDSEVGRWTSTGLGIGTSSPVGKLEVNGLTFVNNTGSTTGRFLIRNSTTGASAGGLDIQQIGVDASINNASNGYMSFSTNNSERMRLSATGNLGLGVTPAAWSGYSVLQINSGFSAWSSGVANARMNANTYYNGGYKYIGTGTATMYEQDGYHAWYNASSGTAGNAITFTQAATLTAAGEFLVGRTSSSGLGQIQSTIGADLATDSGNVYLVRGGGNVGIGTTSPAVRLNPAIDGTSGSTAELVRLTNSSGGGSGTGTSLTYYHSLNTGTLVEGGRIAVVKEATWTTTASTQDANMQFWTTLDGTPTRRASITSAGNFGIGVNTPAVILQTALTTPSATVGNSSTYLGLGGTEDAGGGLHLIGLGFYVAGSSNYYPSYIGTVNTSGAGDTKSDILFYTRDVTTDTAPTERIRITSAGNVGIGTSSPASKLHLASTSSGVAVRLQSASPYAYPGDFSIQVGGFSTPSLGIYDNTNSAYRVILDNAGNLGLGVTPSAWTDYKALQMPGAAFLGYSDGAGNNQAIVAANCYWNGANWIYRTTDQAARYSLYDGQAIWYNAPSGTAGNAITFTQAMTLNASGQLLVGTTSAAGSERLNIVGGTGIRVNEDGVGTKILTIRSDYAGLGPAINVTTTDPLLFLTANTERARIDSSGNLLVGTTSADPIASAVVGISLGSDNLIRAQAVSAPPGIFGRLTTTGDILRFYYSTSITLVGSISTNGTTTSYNITSDQRLKENIQDADSSSSLIDSLQVRKFDWKSDNTHQRYGFIAQELVTVAPEAVHQPTDTEEMMAVDYSKLVPMLVKEIQSLRKRLADAGI